VPDSICDCLPWDSSFFGLRVARLVPTRLSVNDGDGSIGLIGLSPHAQGHSLGSHLLAAAISYFGKRQAARLSVATQGRNVRAQRLYQKCGFATDSVMLWYHKWFRKPKLASTGDTR
jgi:ribosomal protein S18 acetylase RimI-like enzyme